MRQEDSQVSVLKPDLSHPCFFWLIKNGEGRGTGLKCQWRVHWFSLCAFCIITELVKLYYKSQGGLFPAGNQTQVFHITAWWRYITFPGLHGLWSLEAWDIWQTRGRHTRSSACHVDPSPMALEQKLQENNWYMWPDLPGLFPSKGTKSCDQGYIGTTCTKDVPMVQFAKVISWMSTDSHCQS